MIDRIRHDIQDRVEHLLGEADKLRRALIALDPREKPSPRTTPRPSTPGRPAPATRGRPAPATRGRSTAPRARASAASPGTQRTRTAPGETKAKVLKALSADQGMTAGEVAAATGLGRATISTTLSKLAKSGEVIKAERGYKLPAPGRQS